eukprot:TRINITY_DN5_c0_g1_i7.p1 TRINITY_DN5_c0_g1~~TRINITY_DN5_c0_g1_i7.p1  ORF type:complete len:362 (-),score=113.72 TRINITY_DN5_c0_g1_i7:1127-2212(-)
MVNEGGNGRKKSKARLRNKKNKGVSSGGGNQKKPMELTSPMEFVPPPIGEDLSPVVVLPEPRAPLKPSDDDDDDLSKHLYQDEDFVAKSYHFFSELENAEAYVMGKFWNSNEPNAAAASSQEDNESNDLKKKKKKEVAQKSTCTVMSGKQAAASSNDKAVASLASERSFIMIKPDGVQRSLMGVIIKRFESRGFRLVALKLMHASKALLKEHYRDLSGKAFFPELIEYMGSGPCVPMVWEGLHAVAKGREILGATDPGESLPGTIRGDFCIHIGRNVIHGSDSLESAQREIALWFQPGELTLWEPAQVEWLYEDYSLKQHVLLLKHLWMCVVFLKTLKGKWRTRRTKENSFFYSVHIHNSS